MNLWFSTYRVQFNVQEFKKIVVISPVEPIQVARSACFEYDRLDAELVLEKSSLDDDHHGRRPVGEVLAGSLVAVIRNP